MFMEKTLVKFWDVLTYVRKMWHLTYLWGSRAEFTDKCTQHRSTISWYYIAAWRFRKRIAYTYTSEAQRAAVVIKPGGSGLFLSLLDISDGRLTLPMFSHRDGDSLPSAERGVSARKKDAAASRPCSPRGGVPRGCGAKARVQGERDERKKSAVIHGLLPAWMRTSRQRDDGGPPLYHCRVPHGHDTADRAALLMQQLWPPQTNPESCTGR
ncbi:hypothetical protein B0H15DRAFT_160369 [Mycena belliarum]|uniref:Uncharacterized protein n=1 Tax=Mycena belliarum TaxID=1033014 RepID=A0AAD6TL39_9AGAR|nr:hypothetical protein B0H15DRAFT_160369 [Mycena belliae]